MSVDMPDCVHCLHYEEFAPILSCKAFPKGIPLDIIEGTKHTELHKGQIGKYVYTPNEEVLRELEKIK